METTVRRYDGHSDYEAIGRFLVRTYGTFGGRTNWLQPRWEYMHYHPLIRDVDLDPIGIWEAEGEIVAVVHPEHFTGTVYLQIDPAYGALRGEMLEYAEDHLASVSGGTRRLEVHVPDAGDELQSIAAERGYVTGESGERMSSLDIPDPFPPIVLPDGFGLKSLADENDHLKVHRLLWRGFNYGDEPPEDGVDDQQFKQSAPNYRTDLNIVVVAPDGGFVSYCGMWFEPGHAVAYVEPVATDPDYRGLGLGKAAVLEGIRRCAELGATVAYVGSTLPIYRSIGFREIYRESLWVRKWSAAG